MNRWLVALVVLVGCEGRGIRGRLDPPSEPPHDRVEEGVRHARGHDVPFLCRDPSGAGHVPCPTDLRPARADLSCDASGCHGDYDYTPAQRPEDRHLLGSDGPSCWSCHDREWSDQRGATDGGGE